MLFRTRSSVLFAALLYGAVASKGPVFAEGSYGIPSEEAFDRDFERARARARLDHCPLFVYLLPPLSEQQRSSTLATELVTNSLRGFQTVLVDGTKDRELYSSFSADSSNPTFIVFAADGQEVHRWCGWMPDSTFATLVAEARQRHDRYARGEPWNVPSYGASWDDGGFELPGQTPIRAMAVTSGDLWVLQRDPSRLLALDPTSGDIRLDVEAPRGLWNDLAGDEQYLYLLPYGWTAGEAIVQWNVLTGSVDRTIVTEENKGQRSSSAYGLATHGDSLYVAHDWLVISEVDRNSGAIVKRIHVDGTRFGLTSISSLEHDGEHLIALARAKRADNLQESVDGIAVIEPASGHVVEFKVLDFPVIGLALHARGYLTADRVLIDHCRPGWSRKPEHMRVHVFLP